MKLREPIRQKVIDKEKDRAYIDLQRQLERLSEPQLKIVTAMTEPPLHVDEIIRRSGLAARTVLSELTVLQLMGYVTQEQGKHFSLNVNRN